MPINTSQPPIIANKKLAGANVSSQIQGLRQMGGQLAGYTATAFDQLQQSINSLCSLLKAPGNPLESFSVLDSSGALIAWAGSRVVNNINYEGIWAKMLYVGGDSAADAPFFTDSQGNVIIGNNGSIQIDNPLGVQEGFIGVNPDAPINVTAVTNNGGLYEIQTATPNSYITGDAVITNLPGMPTGTGAFAITVIDSTHFTLNNSVFAGSYTGSGTVYRYYGGIWTQTAAFGGTGFVDAPFRVFADGHLEIDNAIIDIRNFTPGVGGTEITLSPNSHSVPTVAGITLNELDALGNFDATQPYTDILAGLISVFSASLGVVSILPNKITATYLGAGGGGIVQASAGGVLGVLSGALPIANGGTGATTVPGAQSALSVYSIAAVNMLLAAKANTGGYSTASGGSPAHSHGFTL